MTLHYLKNGETLRLDASRCTGCGRCIEVCPHGVLAMRDHRAMLVDRAACMECGACMRNCAFAAVTVKAGVGCAAAVIAGLVRGTEPTCGCSGESKGAGCAPLPMAGKRPGPPKGCC